MARKPRDYSAEYARRIAAGQRIGKSRQAARGHRPPPGRTEAGERVRREKARVAMLGGLTSADRQKIRRWYVRLANKMGFDAAEKWAADKSKWERWGMAAFEGYRAAMQAAAADGRKTRGTRSQWMAELAADYGVNFDEAEDWELTAYGALT